MFDFSRKDDYTIVRNGLGIYFLLLIFEGALRKWVVPQLSDPLLLIRDPLAIYLYWKAYKLKALPSNAFLFVVMLTTIVGFYTTMLAGHGSMVVALFGARIMIVQFPLVFLIPSFYSLADVERLGIWMLWITILMTILVGIQFYSPQTAWVNRGIAGNTEGAGFSGAQGYYRVPGTFSFTAVLSVFYGFAAPFVFYFWQQSKQVNKLLLVAASLALFAGIPLSISRTVMVEVLFTFLFYLLVSVHDIKVVGRVFFFAMLAFALLPFLAGLPFMATALDAFTTRFEMANEVEGGASNSFVLRVFGAVLGSASNLGQLPYWGLGIGMGTNAGAKLMTGDNGQFLIAEAEWGRVIGEMGFVLGFSFLFTRVLLSVRMIFMSRQAIAKGNALPWLLASFAVPQMFIGQWGQPAILGFSVFGAGLLLASLQTKAYCEPASTLTHN